MPFQWDRWNEDHLIEDHAVTPEEAEDVFYNHPLKVGKQWVEGEIRHEILGETNEGRSLTVIWTPRQDLIRIITAFGASRKDIQWYRRFKRRRT